MPISRGTAAIPRSVIDARRFIASQSLLTPDVGEVASQIDVLASHKQSTPQTIRSNPLSGGAKRIDPCTNEMPASRVVAQQFADERKLVLNEPPKTPEKVSHVEALTFIARHLWPEDFKGKMETVLTLVAIFLNKWAGFQAPTFLGQITEKLADTKFMSDADSEDARELLRLLTLYSSVKYLGPLMAEVRSSLYARVQRRTIDTCAERIFDRLQNVDLDYIQAALPNTLSTSVLTGSKAVGALSQNVFIRFIPMVYELTKLNKKLKKAQHHDIADMTQIMLAAYGIYTFWYSLLRVAYRQSMGAAEGKMRGFLQESLSNAELVRFMNTSAIENSRFNQAADKVSQSSLHVATSLSKMNAVQQLITHLGQFAALKSIVEKVFAGKAKINELVATQQLLSTIVQPLHFMGTMLREFQVNYDDIRRALMIFHHHPSVVEAQDAKPLIVNRGSVQFQNVSFAYPSQRAQGDSALRNINLRILGGSTVALVGASGSGKSTIAKLLGRLYDPSEGSVAICHQDISKVTLTSLREAVGVVPQETILFNDTLRANLLYGSSAGTTEAELMEAIRLSRLEDAVNNLPNGLDTVVGERGSRLSGGQRQRVAIARCFLKKAPIVVLDEATNQLDQKTEQEIQEAISNLMRGRTIIRIAHNLKNLRDCDQIFVLDKGCVVEAGNHDELLSNSKGKYFSLYHAQPETTPTEAGPQATDEHAGESCGSSCNH